MNQAYPPEGFHELHAVAALGIGAAVLFMVERIAPLRRSRARLGQRLFVNVAISGLALGTSAAVVRPAALASLAWSSEHGSGLVQLVEAPALRLVATFLLMDLSFYYWHQLNHRIPFLWRLHNVHHVDPDLDVSTSIRFHIGEIALSAGFRLVQILIIGPTLAAYLVYEIVFIASTLFHHSNIRLPVRVERILNTLLVTPRMHGIHHSMIREEDQSNYGVVFPWWDRIHRTLRLNVPQSEVVIGIAGYSRHGDNTAWRALLMPFQRQRDYWRSLEGELVERRGAVLSSRSRMAE
jgi:sterol desaturase/sphingolipid hydroxylase (fatty acid hydroxylase superfamily)